ncbi:MAG: resistance to Congo red protein [Candidatus Moraniibacteriota bacterium]
MARTIRITLFALLVLFLGACAAPQPYQGGVATQPSYYVQPYSPPIPAGWANAYTPYMGMHGGRCYFHGFVQPTNADCLSGKIQTPAATPGQALGTTRTIGAQAPAIAGMSPETARMLLDEFARRENPCTAKERTTIVSIGAFIGGAAAAVLTGDLRWAAAGALVGALGGNSEAVMSCQAYTDTRMALLAVLDQYGCSGQVRKTNGVVTDDEICNFRRSYTPGHRPPQIADREVIRPAAVPVARPVPPPPKPRLAPKPRVESEEELPPK